MPLDPVNLVPNGPVKSADIRQFYDVFTGVIADQPLTFRNVVTIGGSQGVTTVPLKVYGAAGQNTNLIDLYLDRASVTPSFGFGAAGQHAWGPGGAAPQDTFMSRIGTQAGHATDTPGLLIVPSLEVQGPVVFQGNLTVTGTLNAGSITATPILDVIDVTRINLKPTASGAFIQAYGGDPTYVHMPKLTVTPGATALASLVVNGPTVINGNQTLNGSLGATGNVGASGTVQGALLTGSRLVVGGYDAGWPANFGGNPITNGRFYQRGNGSAYCWDALDFTPSTAHSGSTVVQRTPEGHIYANYINLTANILGTKPVYVAGQDGDGFLRWYASTAFP